MKKTKERTQPNYGFLAQSKLSEKKEEIIHKRSNSPIPAKHTEHTDKTNLNHFERVLAPLFYDSATMQCEHSLKQTARKFSMCLIKYFCDIFDRQIASIK